MPPRLPTVEAVEDSRKNWELFCPLYHAEFAQDMQLLAKLLLAELYMFPERTRLPKVRRVCEHHLDRDHPGIRARIRIAPNEKPTRLHYHTGGGPLDERYG